MSKRKKMSDAKDKSSGSTSTDNASSVQPGQDLQGSPVRVQMSTSDGSEIATALSDVRNSIPPAFRKNFNLGAFLRGVLQDNDAEIAKMIREKMGDRTVH